MDWQTIQDYIISITPCLTAIISLIAAIIVAIKNVKKIEQSAVDKINEATEDIMKENGEQKRANIEMRNQLNEVLKENAELKRMIREKLDSNVRRQDHGKGK